MRTIPQPIIDKFNLSEIPEDQLTPEWLFYFENEQVAIYKDNVGALWMYVDESQQIICTVYASQRLQFTLDFLVSQPVERIHEYIDTIDEITQREKFAKKIG